VNSNLESKLQKEQKDSKSVTKQNEINCYTKLLYSASDASGALKQLVARQHFLMIIAWTLQFSSSPTAFWACS